jgi:hypothetical protein
MPTTNILFLLGVGIVSAIGIAVTRRITRQVDDARVRDERGSRQLIEQERIALASYLARQRGPWFWLLILSGIVAVSICGLILWHLGFIGS